MSQTIQFVNNIAILTIDMLRQSYHENHLDGSPVGGIYHYQLIDDVMDIAEAYNLKPVITEIFAASNRDKYRLGATTLPQLEKEFGVGAIESHLLRRVYTTIELHKNSTEEQISFDINIPRYSPDERAGFAAGWHLAFTRAKFIIFDVLSPVETDSEISDDG